MHPLALRHPCSRVESQADLPESLQQADLDGYARYRVDCVVWVPGIILIGPGVVAGNLVYLDPVEITIPVGLVALSWHIGPDCRLWVVGVLAVSRREVVGGTVLIAIPDRPQGIVAPQLYY